MKHLKLILKSLFSNNACVEAARTRQVKYNIIAIVFALLGVFLAVLPTTITSFKKSGSDWMNTSYVYNLDTGMYNFTETAKNGNITLTIKEDEKKSKYLEVSGEWDKIATYQPKTTENFSGLTPYVFTHKVDTTENARLFEVYNLTNLDDTTFTTYVSDLLNNLNPTIDRSKAESERYIEWTEKDSKRTKVSRSTSCVFLGKKYIYAYSFKYGTASTVGSMGGDYQNTKVDTELISKAYVANNSTKTFDNWKPFFNEAYINNRWNNSWRSTAIMVGVDAGVLLFMGLMVFILTRGKNNPFRIYSFWDSQKIAYYASFTPSILALAFGFLITNMAMMLYVLAIGIRVMWLSMRTLRYNAPAK